MEWSLARTLPYSLAKAYKEIDKQISVVSRLVGAHKKPGCTTS